MKSLFGVILSVLITFTTLAQSPVEVMGVLSKKKVLPVKLFKVAEGKAVEIATTTPAEKGRFGFLFYPDYEGLYVIGTGTAISATDNYKFYFKPGDRLSFMINDSTYVLIGKLNSKENMVLTDWHNLTNPLLQKSINFMQSRSTFVDYFPQQEEIVAKSKTFLTGKTTGNVKFDKQIKDIMSVDLANYATAFLNTPRSAHPSVEEYSNYYSTLKAQDFAQTTAKVYSHPWGFRTLTSLVNINMRQQGKAYKNGIEGVELVSSYVPNDTLKGDVVLENAARYKSYSDYQGLMAAMGRYIITPSQKKQSEDIMLPLLTYKPGTDAFQFSYPDKEGKAVSMASLKGKVVLVDVWATWCGPCKAEIPHLKKLEEEMKGKDVEIISLSTDAPKDKEKWLKMIKDESLGDTQLFAGGPGNEFSKYYKVNTIPRFLVFDRKGKIVSVDSPRPSNPALKALIEETLATK
ncbi:MAG: TlpA disulfide reductase family protein [Candidatus Pedobacter colombiensis]|uniref:TlpA disulfide reductase family protein n=1 Tax=Candidatus Pedobacter colombiensis TaxID=3121371 RepID=A0AAJ5W883_9SPHI|nr:TlpA disulfide reductase family protein [Pedobacter sp.]WEK18988.1 MAG: TlpA disulfide reductase family protein [Pedobacter sp.]